MKQNTVQISAKGNQFAFLIDGNIVEENISQERVFELLEKCEPEFTNFEVQCWNPENVFWETVVCWENTQW